MDGFCKTSTLSAQNSSLKLLSWRIQKGLLCFVGVFNFCLLNYSRELNNSTQHALRQIRKNGTWLAGMYLFVTPSTDDSILAPHATPNWFCSLCIRQAPFSSPSSSLAAEIYKPHNFRCSPQASSSCMPFKKTEGKRQVPAALRSRSSLCSSRTLFLLFF